ncbi:MAG: fumarate hydratase [Negativicutes bacterium]|jgi:fumarate hydratase class I
MHVIQTEFIKTIAEQLQYISYTMSADFFERYYQAYQKEQSVAAKCALLQVLKNAELAKSTRRPLCQDTGIVIAFLEIGLNVKWVGDMTPEEMINAAVKIAYNDYPANLLRASVVKNPGGNRKNTKNNTPAITHVKITHGDKLIVKLIAKGGGSEFKTTFTVLNPSDSIVDWVVAKMPELGAGWCPPGIIALGIGGTAEKAMLLSKEALFNPLNIGELLRDGAMNDIEQLRIDIYEKINSLKIGAQGFGGDTTVLDVLIKDYPTHAATLPVALTVSCSATRHAHFEYSTHKAPICLSNFIPNLSDAPQSESNNFTHINTNLYSRKDLTKLKAGDRVKLSGKIYTARDAAHQRLQNLFENGEKLPDNLNFNNAFIYYVGPVAAVKDEIIGPAGPTTAKRMDKFSRFMLENLNISGMIGKGERNRDTNILIKKHGAIYFAATGGAACLISQCVKSVRVAAFEDLGMEAIFEFEVEDMPLIVAVDTNGESIYNFN